MIDFYEICGMSREDAESIVTVISKYEQCFVTLAFQNKLNLKASSYMNFSTNDKIMMGLCCFLSFVVCGTVPLVSYIIFESNIFDLTQLSIISCIFSCIALFSIGACTPRTNEKWWSEGLKLLSFIVPCVFTYFGAWGIVIYIDYLVSLDTNTSQNHKSKHHMN